jgi:hypothetical protein
MLSSVSAAALGQVKVRPSKVNELPGVSPAAARASADSELPPPSMPPLRSLGFRFESSVI